MKSVNRMAKRIAWDIVYLVAGLFTLAAWLAVGVMIYAIQTS